MLRYSFKDHLGNGSLDTKNVAAPAAQANRWWGQQLTVFPQS